MGVCAIHSYHKTTPNGTHTAYLFPYKCEPDAHRSCGWLLHYFVYFRLGTGSLLCQYEPTKIALPVDVDQSSIAGLSCGACHTVLWTDDGACYGFGSNSHSQLPLSTDESQNIENQVYISHGYMDIYDRIQKYCLWFSRLGYTEVGPTRWSFLNPQIYSSNVYEIWECLCTTGDIETEKFSCTIHDAMNTDSVYLLFQICSLYCVVVSVSMLLTILFSSLPQKSACFVVLLWIDLMFS